MLSFFVSLFPPFLRCFFLSLFLPSWYSFISCVLYVFFLNLFLFSFGISFFLSFFLSFSRLGLEYFVFFVIPDREARNTVFYYKIQDFVFFLILVFLILICFLFNPPPEKDDDNPNSQIPCRRMPGATPRSMRSCRGTPDRCDLIACCVKQFAKLTLEAAGYYCPWNWPRLSKKKAL